MRKIILYIATSVNGKIARKNGSVDWLEAMPNPEKLDYGFANMYASVDTTIQGYHSFKQVIDWDIPFPYQGKKNFVLTSQSSRTPHKDAHFVEKDHAAFITELKQADGKDIWLIGGGKTIAFMLEHQLIDEIQLFIMPIILKDGIDLVAILEKDTMLSLKNTKAFDTGVVQLNYGISASSE